MSREEIDRAIRDADRYAEEDRQRREARQSESRSPKSTGSSGAGDDGAYDV